MLPVAFSPHRVARFALVLAAASVRVLTADAQSPQLAHPASTRVLPIASDAFAGSSVNVLAGLQHTLFTHGDTQYAAFYAADSTLVLARRTLGSDTWETHRTAYTGRTADAHNTVSIAVDGIGILHVAWDHHGNALNYARSVAPGSLELGPRQSMTGQLESKVTYPAFLRLPDGDLLFFYRNGASGRGDLVLNRYAAATSTWTQLHTKLLDGEGQRSAYPSFTVDPNGTLHLAWVWRETPDVSTNHDLAYARSADGGLAWTTSSGDALKIPISAATAEYALRIPQNRSLMNPPAIAADEKGRPFLANYWTPEGSDIPQYHIVHHDGKAWHSQIVTQRTTPFKLAGTSTKRPPISRAILVTDRQPGKPLTGHLVFRDDERNGRAVIASSPDLESEKPAWTLSDLTADSLGAWEPSFDPEQWRRFTQLHLLVQKVEQRDGNDRDAAPVPPSPISSLIWSPIRSSP